MKKLSFVLITLLLSGCSQRIGNLTMVSTRNIDSKTDYVELKRHVKAKGRDMEIAIEKAVKKDPNGEFLKNAVIYQGFRIKVVGDVWGVKRDSL